MEWVKKKDFGDYLREATAAESSPIYREESTTPAFLFSLEAPNLKQTSGYKVKPLTIEERKDRYIANLNETRLAAWLWLEEAAKAHHILALPWEGKVLFRKLAIKLHPDQSKDPQAHEKFMQLQTKFKIFSEAQA